jgi:parallel beta-helix repeat protein
LDPGDIVHIDTGTYRVYENMRLEATDSGVRFEGPGALPTGQVLGATATFNRGNTQSTQSVFELAGADDVAIDFLHLTGGNVGVWAPHGAQSLRLTVSNSQVFSAGGSEATGIAIGQSNTDARILNNKLFNNNATTGTGKGIYTAGARALIEGNEAFGQVFGIYSDSTGSIAPADAAIIRNNIVRNNSGVGIRGYQDDQIVGNTVFGHSGVNAAGIDVLGSDVLNNSVYNNYNGIVTAGSWVGEVKANRAYGNSNVGIWVRGVNSTIGNHVYNNGAGIYVNAGAALIANNVVYGNTNQGMLVESSGGPSLVNNTVYQSVGDAVRLRGGNSNVKLRNNVIWIDSGYAINVDGGSQGGFSSNYNVLYQSTDPNAHVGLWGGVIRDSLADWQAANSQDTNSVTGDPLFVDRDGSDNVLGYRSSDGYDGGRDDNFFLRGGSPAIDRGDGAAAPVTDAIGAPRFDDAGTTNNGTPAGLAYVDLGAYEFQGSSLDVTAPLVLSTNPAGVHNATQLPPFNQLTLQFNEPINFIDATAAANYELRGAGTNGILGDSDDTIITLNPSYTVGSTSIVLALSGNLLPGTYQLTVFGTGGRGLRDLAGLVIDGDNNGAAGGDYVRTFTIPVPPGDYNRDGFVNDSDYTFWKTHYGATSGIGLQADGNGNGVVDAAAYVVWRKFTSPAPGAGGAALAGEHTASVVATLNDQPAQATITHSNAAHAFVASADIVAVAHDPEPAVQTFTEMFDTPTSSPAVRAMVLRTAAIDGTLEQLDDQMAMLLTAPLQSRDAAFEADLLFVAEEDGFDSDSEQVFLDSVWDEMTAELCLLL